MITAVSFSLFLYIVFNHIYVFFIKRFRNTTVDIQLRENDALLELPSPDTHKAERLES